MGRGETNAKKRKRLAEANASIAPISKSAKLSPPADVAASAPALAATTQGPRGGRKWTLSVALPSSITQDVSSQHQRTAIVGQVARALSVFSVDEIVIFDDGEPLHTVNGTSRSSSSEDATQSIIHLLSYLETPPNLQSSLFPADAIPPHADTVPALNIPHHLSAETWLPYREGVTLPGSNDNGTLVEAGLRIPVTVEDRIPPNTRVTLKLDQEAERAHRDAKAKVIIAEPVGPDEPREEAGLYWGYKIRKAESLSSIFTECEYEDGYDVSIGSSDTGFPVERLYSSDDGNNVSSFKHMVVVFGGPSGLDAAVKNDTEFQKLGVKSAKDVFDRWVDILAEIDTQLRTEEELWIGLTRLRKVVAGNK